MARDADVSLASMSISAVVILGYKPSYMDCANSVTDTYRESISEDKFCNRRSIFIFVCCCCCCCCCCYMCVKCEKVETGRFIS